MLQKQVARTLNWIQGKQYRECHTSTEHGILESAPKASTMNSQQSSPQHPLGSATLEIKILTHSISNTDCICSNVGTDCSFFSWAPDEVVSWLAFRGSVIWKICVFKHQTARGDVQSPGNERTSALEQQTHSPHVSVQWLAYHPRSSRSSHSSVTPFFFGLFNWVGQN